MSLALNECAIIMIVQLSNIPTPSDLSFTLYHEQNFGFNSARYDVHFSRIGQRPTVHSYVNSKTEQNAEDRRPNIQLNPANESSNPIRLSIPSQHATVTGLTRTKSYPMPTRYAYIAHTCPKPVHI